MNDTERHSIEDRGREFSENLKHRMYSGTEQKYPYVPIKSEDILKLPRLVIDGSEFPSRERFQEDLRYDPITGAIYTTRWAELKTFTDPETGIRSVQHPENLTFISQNNPIPDPEDLPKSGKAIQLVVGEVWDGLETAIRQQHHILEGYEPTSITAEPQALQRVLTWIYQTSGKFTEGPVTDDQLDQWSQEAAELVVQTGLASATDSTKKKLAGMLTKATQTDSLGRINPMVSRIRLRSALLAATRRFVTDELAAKKFSTNLRTLVATRKYIRNVLEDAAENLWCRPGLLKVQEVARWELSVPQVAPYLLPTRLAAILLVGCRESKKELNRQVLGDETARDLFRLEPATTLLEKGDASGAGDRISWARYSLVRVLEENNEV